MTDSRGVCAPSAKDLRPDVSYVRGWTDGKRAADSLAGALHALGLEHDLPGLRADVNVFGEGVVSLGQLRPAAVELLTRALTSGLAAEIAQHATGSDTAARDDVS